MRGDEGTGASGPLIFTVFFLIALFLGGGLLSCRSDDEAPRPATVLAATESKSDTRSGAVEKLSGLDPGGGATPLASHAPKPMLPADRARDSQHDYAAAGQAQSKKVVPEAVRPPAHQSPAATENLSKSIIGLRQDASDEDHKDANRYPPKGTVEQNALASPLLADPNTDAWHAVERIDQKIANAIMLITFFAGLLSALAIYFQYQQQKYVSDVRKEIDEKVSEQTRRFFYDLEDKHRLQLTRMLEDHVGRESRRQIGMLMEIGSIGERPLHAFLTNEIGHDGDVVGPRQLRRIFEFQRALHLTSDPDAKNVEAGLAALSAMLKDLSPVTASHLLHFLVTVERAERIRDFENRRDWNELVHALEKTTGVSRHKVSS